MDYVEHSGSLCVVWWGYAALFALDFPITLAGIVCHFSMLNRPNQPHFWYPNPFCQVS